MLFKALLSVASTSVTSVHAFNRRDVALRVWWLRLRRQKAQTTQSHALASWRGGFAMVIVNYSG